ncbi:MAG: M1 family metallopeptidase [Pseudomonadota bacterium]
MRASVIVLVWSAAILAPFANGEKETNEHVVDKFRQLGYLLADPNVYRNADGAPGPDYWQQQADYKIKATLDENGHVLTARQTITYANNSPHTLRYIWLQLDQNRFDQNSLENRSRTGSVGDLGEDRVSFSQMRRHQAQQDRDYGFDIGEITSGGKAIAYTIVDTMLRIDLPTPLKPKSRFVFDVAWSFNITEKDALGSRGGYEWFEETDTYLYNLAQWYPRVVAYTDYTSWQHKQFLGRGEFTLEFGDYDVEITVPADHIVAATGELANAKEVLTSTQRQRLSDAEDADTPVFIVTPEEAAENEKEGTERTKTWRFVAKEVRDFAWATSRKFIWDAQGYEQKGDPGLVMAMSFYPNEAEPIWSQYSTAAVIHTMEVYSRFSFPYPYPTAQSVNSRKLGGMEYPMITFNGYRPDPIEEDDRKSMIEGAPSESYSRSIKHRLIGVIIHEIGHIYFPMVVNSDEREWTWMDEGINSFLDHVAGVEWEENWYRYASAPSILDQIAPYMVSDGQVPIMTQSDSVLQFGPNAYTKPAAALVVLRETVMGRELFDFAFVEYARRWKFKRPTPTDFFRTMEDASAVDLDWFWRGWFYSTDHVDVDLSAVREYQVSSKDPDIEYPLRHDLDQDKYAEPIDQIRNREEGRLTFRARVEGLDDFYNVNDQYTVSNKDRNDYQTYIESLEPWERRTLERAVQAGEYIYFVDFKNKGGLLTPLPVKITFADGQVEERDIPVEIWRRNSEQVTSVMIMPQRIDSIEFDPRQQTADVDRSNNHFPRKIVPSRLELYKRENTTRDLMRDMLVKLKTEGAEDDGTSLPLEPGS